MIWISQERWLLSLLRPVYDNPNLINALSVILSNVFYYDFLLSCYFNSLLIKFSSYTCPYHYYYSFSYFIYHIYSFSFIYIYVTVLRELIQKEFSVFYGSILQFIQLSLFFLLSDLIVIGDFQKDKNKE